MKRIMMIASALLVSIVLTACGTRVEVPPAHQGKIMTKDGYQEGTVGPSKFRLAPCLAYCDNLVLLDASDKAVTETMTIFMPKDKLNLDIALRVTLSLNPSQTDKLFATLKQDGEIDSRTKSISWAQIYQTYAQQVILTETREYVSRYSIAEISSSLDKVNSDLRVVLGEKLKVTPFNVRYIGVTNVEYPKIIVDAQIGAAQRREQIQQEEAQKEVSRVRLERELAEAQLQRTIEVEKAETEAASQRTIAASIDPRVLELRRLQVQEQQIEAWKAGGSKVPTTLITGEGSNGHNFLLNVGGLDK